MLSKLFKSLWILLIAISLFAGCQQQSNKNQAQTRWLLVPYPQKILNRGGITTFNNEFWVIADLSNPRSTKMANYLVNELSTLTGRTVLITDLYSTRKHKQSVSITLAADTDNADGYSLDLTSSQIQIKANSEQGLYYGIQTLLQVLLDHQKKKMEYELPNAIIKDWPEFQIRGILLTKHQIESIDDRMIIALAKLKFNAIFVASTTTLSDSLIETAKSNFIEVRLSDSITSKDYQIINADPLLTFDEVYLTKYFNKKTQGAVIDLKQLSSKQVNKLLPAYSEQLWSAPAFKDLDRINLWLSIKY